MSCQHATRMGAFAGNNAAAELLGIPTTRITRKVSGRWSMTLQKTKQEIIDTGRGIRSV